MLKKKGRFEQETLQKEDKEDDALRPESVIVGYKDIQDKLERMGLSRLESKIYVELFQNGPRKASDLSRALDANRVDVYRSVKRMRQRGILDVAFARPLSFSAVEPDVLAQVLDSEQELAVRAFKKEAELVKGQLLSLPRNRRQEEQGSRFIPGAATRGAQFQLKYGRQIFEKWKKMIENTKDEMMIILSHVGLMTHSIEGFSELYSKAVRRGVSIKMITDVNAENYDQAIEFSKILSMRVSKSVNEILRYVISDNRELMISSGYFSNDPKEFTAICTDNALMIKALKLDFEDKWRRSRLLRPQVTI